MVVQILGQLVGMLVFADGQEARDSVDDYVDVSAQLVIWDWTTSQQVAVSVPILLSTEHCVQVIDDIIAISAYQDCRVRSRSPS